MHSVREFYRDASLILKPLLEKALRRNSFQLNEQKYLRTHGTAMVTKKAVAFSKISTAKMETQIFVKVFWKRYINNIISRLLTNRYVFAMLENFVDYRILWLLGLAG